EGRVTPVAQPPREVPLRVEEPRTAVAMLEVDRRVAARLAAPEIAAAVPQPVAVHQLGAARGIRRVAALQLAETAAQVGMDPTWTKAARAMPCPAKGPTSSKTIYDWARSVS